MPKYVPPKSTIVVEKSVAQTINNETNTTIDDWDTATVTGSKLSFNDVTGVIGILADGVYTISFKAYFSNSITTGTRVAYAVLNSDFTRQYAGSALAATTVGIGNSGAITLPLVNGDNVRIGVWHNAGNILDIGGATFQRCFLEVSEV